MTRHTYGILSIAQRHADLFSTLTKPRPPQALQHFTEQQLHERALQELAMRADQLRGLPSVFGSLA